jgi:hypothetical protein
VPAACRRLTNARWCRARSYSTAALREGAELRSEHEATHAELAREMAAARAAAAGEYESQMVAHGRAQDERLREQVRAVAEGQAALAAVRVAAADAAARGAAELAAARDAAETSIARRLLLLVESKDAEVAAAQAGADARVATAQAELSAFAGELQVCSAAKPQSMLCRARDAQPKLPARALRHAPMLTRVGAAPGPQHELAGVTAGGGTAGGCGRRRRW